MAEPTSDEVPLDRLLVAALRPVLGDVDVAELRRLTGGASRETWSFDATSSDGTVHALILRRDPPGRPGPAGSMGREARCIVAAGEAGLPVPRVLVHSDDVSVLGAAGIVMARVEGEAIARKILRDERFTRARRGLVASCGAALAGVHRLDPSVLGDGSPSAFGGEDDERRGRQRRGRQRRRRRGCRWRGGGRGRGRRDGRGAGPARGDAGALDSLGRTTPVFEYVLRWLEAHRPAPTAAPSLVHGDFRLGNLMVDDDGLRRRARLGAGPPRRSRGGPRLALRAGVALRSGGPRRRARRARGAARRLRRRRSACRSTPRCCGGGRSRATSALGGHLHGGRQRLLAGRPVGRAAASVVVSPRPSGTCCC